MQQFGVGVALVGRDPEAARLCCNAITMRDGDLSTREALKDYSFERQVNLTSAPAIREAFSELTKVVAGLVALQMFAADEAERECPKIPIVAGKESLAHYDFDLIQRVITPNLEHLEDFTPEQHQELIPLAVIMKNAYIKFGNFTRSAHAESSEIEVLKQRVLDGKDEYNEGLRALVEEFRKEQSSGELGDAYHQLLEIAEARGQVLAESFNVAYDRMGAPHLTAKMVFCRETPLWKELPHSAALQEQALCQSFYSLHPDFHDAMRREYAAHQGIEEQVYLKLPTEADALFFTDVVAVLLQEQHKVVMGFLPPRERFQHAELKDWGARDQNGAPSWKAQLFKQYSYIPDDDFQGELFRRIVQFAAFGERPGDLEA